MTINGINIKNQNMKHCMMSTKLHMNMLMKWDLKQLSLEPY